MRPPYAPGSSRSVAATASATAPVSGGVVITLEKVLDRNGIPMLSPSADDPSIAAFHGMRSGRSSAEARVPLRLFASRLRLLTEEEGAAALASAACDEFLVRYSGGENGAPIEPVEILPHGLSLADYEISFAAGAAALRVDHRLDGPVKCRAEPAAQKQVFSDTPVELYTQAVDEETHNIVQLYFSDLRDEVAVDVLNLTGTDVSLEDAECITFDADATGAALNYKIIVRDGRVVAVLYQEGGEVRHSPFIEHALPPPGSFVTLADGSLGILQALPRGLVVARTPRELPELPSQWAPRAGLRRKGKHPAELPGMVDVKVVQSRGQVAWPQDECAAPVCALSTAEGARLQAWHAQWDAFVGEKTAAAASLADRIDQLLKGGGGGGGGAAAVTELTALYGELEESQRELDDLEAPGIGEDRLANLQRGIQRFAACARFS